MSGLQPAQPADRGDYFDFLALNEDVFTVTIADVSGTGPASAILMAACEAMLTALIETDVSLQERVTSINRYLLTHSAPNQFVSLFHAELDCRTQTLRYCNAGHNPPLLVPNRGAVQGLASTGIVLGVVDLPYDVSTVPFEPETTLVLYTDGVTEALSAQGEEYTDSRLMDLVKENRQLAIQELRDAILHDIEGFTTGAEHPDDLTIVLVRNVGT